MAESVTGSFEVANDQPKAKSPEQLAAKLHTTTDALRQAIDQKFFAYSTPNDMRNMTEYLNKIGDPRELADALWIVAVQDAPARSVPAGMSNAKDSWVTRLASMLGLKRIADKYSVRPSSD